VLRGLAAICPDTIVADGLADTLGRSLGIDESRSPVEVFMGLADRGLLIRTPGGYIVPRLVAEYVRSQEPWDPLRLESVASTVESHAEAICHFGTLREIRDVVPHVLEMLDVLTSLPQGASRTTGGLCCLAAHYYAEIGEYKTAGDFAERGCRADASLKGDSQLAARNLEALGAVQHASGNIQDSLATLHRARAVASGDTDPRTALCLELRLAGVLIETGSPGDALTAVERAEALLDQHPEVGPLLTILLLSTKGTVWTATAKYAGARSCFERALDLASMGAHRHHSIYGQTLRSYARLLTILNSFSEAKSAGERALWNDLDTLGQRHPAVGFDYLTLAQVYQEYQRFTDAKTMYEKGIGLLGLTFSDDNIWIAQAKYECQLGNPMEPSLRRQSAACNVLPALAEHFGPRSEVVALVYARLGAELFVAGDWEHGAKLDERAQEILFELYGPTHPRSVSAELNRVLMSGRPAEQRFREFLDAFRAQYGADHRLIAVAHLDLAYILIEKGKSVRDACAHLEAGLTTLNRIYGRMTPLSISFLDGLAVGYLLLGEFENSRQLWHETDRLHTLLETDDDDGTKKLKRRPTPIGTFGLYFWWLAMRVRIYANRITRMYQ
jgi:tetratricopeptide (TPR) repeat protein